MKNNIILASKSPRRIKLMKEYGYDPIVIPSRADENLPDFLSPESSVMFLAFLKAYDVASKHAQLPEDVVVIGSDTVVVHNGRIIGKPEGPSEAFNILDKLRDDSHYVITGVCLIRKSGDTYSKECFFERTDVFFKDYSDEELLAYVNTDEPYDKAGGYAIQGTFSKYVDHIEGDYNNVVGFPIDSIIRRL